MQESWGNLIRSCRDISQARQLHSAIPPTIYLSNLLIEMYGRLGNLADAHLAFSSIRSPNRFSWNILFQAHVNNNHLQHAKSIFDLMPEFDLVSFNSMLAAYAQRGHLHEAQHLFHHSLPEHNVVSWTTLIAAFAHNEDLAGAASVFQIIPEKNVVTWTIMLVAHAELGDLDQAQRLFDLMPQRNLVALTAMVAAFAQNNHLLEAQRLFDRMPERNAVSWTALLLAYLESGAIAEARDLLDAMPEMNVIASTAMLSAYAENAQLDHAKSLFDSMEDRNLVSWTAMLVAYSKSGRPSEALHLFAVMDLEGLQADAVSFITVIDACADFNALIQGKLLHFEAVQSGFQSDPVLSNALINMYARCGRLAAARRIFDSMPELSQPSWNAIIAAYTHNGHCRPALRLFLAMKIQGFDPDEISFVSILSACGHAGRMQDAIACFASIRTDFGANQSSNHYRCLIDALGRSGRLKDAQDLIAVMPFQPDCMAWTSVLGAACRTSGEVDHAANAAERAALLEPNCPTSYILLSNALNQQSELQKC